MRAVFQIARILALLGALQAAQMVLAGEAITAFQPGKPLPPEALRHVQVKAVVAEFLDPDRTSLGKEVSYLVWREILTAISDQSGAGVIIAHPPGQERLVDLLQRDYHEAAIAIAASQKARTAVWGAVSEDGDQVFVDTYLSLVGETPREELALRLHWGDPGRLKDVKDTGFAARLSRTRFNYPRVTTTREALFVRPLIAQGKAAIRAQLGAGATLATVAAGDLLQAVGMQGSWFRVRLASGREGWIDSWNVHVPPRVVDARVSQPLRSAPGSKANAATAQVAEGSALAVLQSRYVTGQGLWYRVSTAQAQGWVPATQVYTRFSFPVVHFVAGLYRYQLGRYEDAVREFEQYTRADGVQADAPSLSSAYQMLGASHLMAGSARGAAEAVDSQRLNRAFDMAAKTTPFDPSVYTLRAVATLATRKSIYAALPDLAHALELDADNADARGVLARMRSITGTPGDPAREFLRREFSERPKIGDSVNELARRYAVTP